MTETTITPIDPASAGDICFKLKGESYASQVLTMSEEELRAKLASEGHDFDQVAKDTKALLLSALMKASEQHFEQVDQQPLCTCSECESPCELEDHCLDCGIAVCAECRGDYTTL